jgi:hypothetical protein
MVRQLACSLFVLAMATAAGAQQVVHLDARVNGGHTLGFPVVEVPLTAGHWSATLIEPSTDLEAIFQAWAFNIGATGTWGTSYRIFLADDTQLPSGGLFAEALTPQDAWDETVAAGRDVHIFTVPEDQDVIFDIGDNQLADNQGGVSFRLEPSEVPEPGALLQAAAGSLVLMAAARRKRRRGARAG